MIDFYFRNKSGMLVMSGICNENEIEYQSCGDAILEIGKADITKQYYGKNGLTLYPEKPGDSYKFDFATEKWVFNDEDAINKALSKRDKLLFEGPDRISPLWYDSMTNEQREAWAQYRQDLLDITQQPNYPRDIIWPIKPTEGA